MRLALDHMIVIRFSSVKTWETFQKEPECFLSSQMFCLCEQHKQTRLHVALIGATNAAHKHFLKILKRAGNGWRAAA